MIYLKRWKAFSKYLQSFTHSFVLANILQSKQLLKTRMLFMIKYYSINDIEKHGYYLLDNIEQFKINNFPKTVNHLHSIRLLSSEINYHNQHVELQQLIEQYQDHSHVNLSGQELTDVDMKIIAKEVIIEKQCKQLLLDSNRITSVGVSVLAQALHNNQSMNYLDLSHNQISDDGVYFLVKTLSTNNNTLKKLGLAKNEITDNGIKHLVQMIQNNKTLTQLDLCSNKISNEGIRLLTDTIVSYNSTIEMLWLTSNTLLTDTSIDFIIKMIKHSRSLKKLWIFKCSFSEVGKEKLKELERLKPNFKVYVNNWKD